MTNCYSKTVGVMPKQQWKEVNSACHSQHLESYLAFEEGCAKAPSLPHGWQSYSLETVECAVAEQGAIKTISSCRPFECLAAGAAAHVYADPGNFVLNGISRLKYRLARIRRQMHGKAMSRTTPLNPPAVESLSGGNQHGGLTGGLARGGVGGVVGWG